MPGSPFLFQHRPFRDMPRFQAKLQDRNGSTITTIPQSTSTKVPFNDLPKYPLLLHYRPSRDMPGPVIISKTSLGIESYKDALDIQREGLLMTCPGPHCFSNIGLSGKCSGPKPTLQTTSAWLLHYSPLDFLKRPFNDLPRSPMLPQYGIFGDINRSQNHKSHPYSKTEASPHWRQQAFMPTCQGNHTHISTVTASPDGRPQAFMPMFQGSQIYISTDTASPDGRPQAFTPIFQGSQIHAATDTASSDGRTQAFTPMFQGSREEKLQYTIWLSFLCLLKSVLTIGDDKEQTYITTIKPFALYKNIYFFNCLYFRLLNISLFYFALDRIFIFIFFRRSDLYAK